jgi:hypothetical protein
MSCTELDAGKGIPHEEVKRRLGGIGALRLIHVFCDAAAGR